MTEVGENLHTLLPDLYDDMEKVDESKALMTKLVNVVLQSESIKLLYETSNELGIDRELVKKAIEYILEAFFKDRDLLESLGKLETYDADDTRDVVAYILLKKP